MADLEQNPLSFQRVQAELSASIRDPQNESGPAGIEQRRLAVYHRLFYNNIERFCAASFKTFRDIVDDEYWHELVRGFIRRHQCTTPFFREIPGEFLEFLASKGQISEDYPYVLELCHFEYLRTELLLAPDDPSFGGEIGGLDQQVELSPLVRLLSFQWPVHKIDSNYAETKPPDHPTWIIGFRGPSDNVEFLVSNAHTLRMLEMIREPTTVGQLVQRMSTEFGMDESRLQERTLAALNRFVGSGIVLVAS